MSAICLPDVLMRDQISQAFTLHICILQVINTGGGYGLGIGLLSRKAAPQTAAHLGHFKLIGSPKWEELQNSKDAEVHN